MSCRVNLVFCNPTISHFYMYHHFLLYAGILMAVLEAGCSADKPPQNNLEIALVGMELQIGNPAIGHPYFIYDVFSMYKIRFINHSLKDIDGEICQRNLEDKSDSTPYRKGLYILDGTDTLQLCPSLRPGNDCVEFRVPAQDTLYEYFTRGDSYSHDESPLETKIERVANRLDSINKRGASLVYFDQEINRSVISSFKNIYFNSLYVLGLEPMESPIYTVDEQD